MQFIVKKVRDREVNYPVYDKKTYPPFWHQKLNHLLTLQFNPWITQSSEYREYFSKPYRIAQEQGFLRELPLIFLRAKKGSYETETQIIEALKQYHSRSTCPSGLLEVIRERGLQHLLNERFPTHATQDRDVFYLIHLEQNKNGKVLCKVGVTSFHLGRQREKKFVARLALWVAAGSFISNATIYLK